MSQDTVPVRKPLFSTNHGHTNPAYRWLEGIFLWQVPLLNGHVATRIVLTAMYRA
ncbi:MAG: hypothetical protein QM324_01670 [Bacteroidota bacterium]|nr:hypothetical protein [Bacteroidota bacterium]